MPTAKLFIDYQNVHLTAYECFAPYGAQLYDCLIHPGKFADQILASRRQRSFDEIVLTEIHVFRGLPSRRNEANQHARGQRQASNWTRDRRVKMHLRTLRYPRDWPQSRAQEKGVDVALAVEVARAAITGTAEILIVASRDTDIVPALDLVQNDTAATIELAFWAGQSDLKLTPQPRSVTLNESDYKRSRDTYNYS